MHFAVASFMLALIGLKKFRSFQEPNRIDVLEKKTTTTHTTPGLLFKKSMTTDLLQDQRIIIMIIIIIIIIIIIRSVSGPAPEWRGVSRSRGSPGDGSRAGLGAQRRN